MTGTPWQGASVVVTGAASGIGLALSAALVERGADVWMADVSAEALARSAAALGPKAHPATLDVRDAPAVRDLVERVARDTGRLDCLFNNAGIGVSGEVRELSVEHFDRIVDVNIRGVVNGIVAAYPILVKQGRGHIVNTASLAGLTPVPLLVPYAMTKHAVVGLSTSLRLEAARYGVRVSALCPAAVETPMLDAENPADLRSAWRPDIRRYLSRLAGPAYPVARLAADALRGVERNQGIIIAPAQARAAAFLYRMAPELVQRLGQRAFLAELKNRR